MKFGKPGKNFPQNPGVLGGFLGKKFPTFAPPGLSNPGRGGREKGDAPLFLGWGGGNPWGQTFKTAKRL